MIRFAEKASKKHKEAQAEVMTRKLALLFFFCRICILLFAKARFYMALMRIFLGYAIRFFLKFNALASLPMSSSCSSLMHSGTIGQRF